jgi:hypothetical protein
LPTKRRKIPPKRINELMPAWAERLLAGERPAPGSDDEQAMVGWQYFGDPVSGLPDPMSEEGYRLWRPKGAS